MKALLLVAVLFAWLPAAQAQSTVYKTVDEGGVVSFSDTPPTGVAEAEVEQLEIQAPAAQPGDEYRQNLEAMRETTDRMAEDRRAREKHRAEMRELQARTEAHQQPPPGPTQDFSSYSRVWGGGAYYRPGYPPWRPGHRPRPEPPIVRPPLYPAHPGVSRPTDNNSQLMRPILSR